MLILKRTVHIAVIVFFICLISTKSSGQYIEQLCPDAALQLDQSNYEDAILILEECLTRTESTEDSLLMLLNKARALLLQRKTPEGNEILDNVLVEKYSKLYKARCLALEWRARSYMMSDKNLHLHYWKESDSVATANTFTEGQLRASVSIGNAYYTLFRDLNSAYPYLIKALAFENIPDDYYLSTVSGAYDTSFKLAKENTDSIYALGIAFIDRRLKEHITSKDSSSIGSFYGLVGNNLLAKGDFKSALEHNLRAVKYKPKTKRFQYSLARLYFNIARIFQALSNFEKAQEYTDRMEAVAVKNNFKSLMKDVMALRGSTFIKLNQLEEAKASYITFLVLNEKSRVKQNSISITAHADLAFIYMQQDSMSKAEHYIEKGIELLSQTKEGESHMNMHSILSNYHLKKKEYSKALSEANILMGLSIKFNNIRFKNIATDYISRAQYGLKNYNHAYLSLRQSNRIQDSIFRTEQNYLAHDLEAKYLKKEQDLEIDKLQTKDLLSQERLSSQKRIIMIGGISLGLISLLSFFLLRQRQKIGRQNSVISSALSEKELLLKEIHHRVKNNLQVVSSLLGLQSEYIKDDNALTAINEGRNRVRSMALIHQNLYSEENLTGVNVKTYLETLISGLFDTYNINEDKIQLHLDIQDIDLDVDTVVPLGLIANELVSNALKHAFTDQEEGIIHVTLSEQNNVLKFIVSDNGKGMDTSILMEDMESFGYQMISAFKEKLNAHLNIDGSNGTKIEMLIKDYQKILTT